MVEAVLRAGVRAVAAMCVTLTILSAEARAQTATAPDVAAQLRALTQAVTELQAALAAAKQDAATLRRELDVIRGALETARKTGSDPALAALAQDLELLAAKVDDQEQTKVESGSKYHVRLSGLVLFSAGYAHGAVNSLDLPLTAMTPAAGESSGGIVAGVRQSFITVSVFGPTVGGARTSGSVAFDFFGGFPGTGDGVTAAHGRLRTASLALDWAHTSLTAGQEAPFFSPLNPTTIASVAYPGFSSAGNIWSWTPQIALTHRVAAGDDRLLALQAGVLDPLTGEAPASEYARTPTAGERSRRPAIAARVALEQAGDHEQTWGIGVYQSSQNWGFSRTVNAWAVTADAHLVAGTRLQFNGEAYRGQGIAGLGAGTAPAVAFNGDPQVATTAVRVVESAGGWVEAQLNLNTRVHLIAGVGGDRADGTALPWLRAVDATAPKSNRAVSGALMVRPRSNLVFSLEYRRLLTDGLDDVKRRAHVVTLGGGILF